MAASGWSYPAPPSQEQNSDSLAIVETLGVAEALTRLAGSPVMLVDLSGPVDALPLLLVAALPLDGQTMIELHPMISDPCLAPYRMRCVSHLVWLLEQLINGWTHP